MAEILTSCDAFPRTMGNGDLHAIKLQQIMYDQMQSGSELCDVTLTVQDVEIKAHWSVLVLCPYFQSVYDSGLKEKISGNISLHIGKASAVRTAISFLYTGTAEISYENVNDILEISDYFQIAELKSCCEDYLKDVDVTIDNCVHISLLCSMYNLDLYNQVFKYLRGHLPEIMEKEDVLTLTSDSVLSLLTDPTLSYVEQLQFYHFIIKWVEFDLENREQDFPDLFCSLDLKKIPRDKLENIIEKNPLVSKMERCQVHVLNIKMKFMAGLIKEESLKKEAILIAGGYGQLKFLENLFHIFPLSESIAVNTLYGYLLEEDRWIQLAPLPYQMRMPLMAFCPKRECLYMFDTGHMNFSAKVFMYKFCIRESTWSSFVLEMHDKYSSRTLHSIMVCNQQLYAVISCQVEEENERQMWYTLIVEVKEDGTPSQVKHSLFARNQTTQISSCVMYDRHICILAQKTGVSSKKRRNIAKFVVYDTRSNRFFDRSKGASWDQIMIPVGNEIIVFRMGKYSCKKYSFPERKWRTDKDIFVPFPPEKFDSTEYCSLSDGSNFYIFGGKKHSDSEVVNTAYAFNYYSKKWRNIQELPEPLKQSSACVVQLPSNITQCHINCPHCEYSPCRNRAVYNVHYPRDEEDFDEYSEYSVDDEYLSDPADWSDYLDYEDDYWMM